MVKVFLVEDESIIRRGIRDNIAWESHGFEFVGEAGDGEYAYPLLLNTKPDILITDIKMPFMDGLELCRILTDRLPAARFVVFSGFDAFEYAKQAIQMNVVEYILKPINADELSAVLRRLNRELGMSILFISHNLAVVRKLCTRVAVMEKGHIVETGPVEDIFFHPQAPYTQRLIAAIPTRRKL